MHTSRLAHASNTQTASRRLTRIALTVAIAGVLIAAAGCSGRGEASGRAHAGVGASQKVTSFAIVTPEKESDHGWNQQGLQGAHAAAKELGIDVAEHSDVGYDNTETILTQVAQTNVGLIIAHASGFNAAGKRIAEQTGVPTLVVDYENNIPGKVATVIPSPEQGGYLAGIAAAKQTETHTVGVVASAENLNWFLMAGGFAQGVYSVDPSINIVIAYVGPANYGDSVGGASVANQVIAAGADVIMGMGDGATIGYLQAIETANAGHPVSYIGTIGDVSKIVKKPDTLLTSVLWNYKDTYVQAIKDIEDGTFGTKTYDLDVADGGMTLQQTARLSSDSKAAVERATQQIKSGDIHVIATPDKASVQLIIDAKGA